MKTRLSRLNKRTIGLVVFVLVVAAAIFFLGGPQTSTDSLSQGNNAKIESASLADLKDTVTAVGTAEYSRIIDIAVSQSSLITEVLFAAGDSVSAGQKLVQLDASTAARSLADRELALREAQHALDELKEPPDPIAVVKAKLTLEAKQSDFENLSQDPDESDLAAANASLASAQSSLARAQADLSTAETGPTAEDISRKQATFETAEADWLTKQKTLESLRDKPTPDTLADASAVLEKALLTRNSTNKSKTANSETKAKSELDYQIAQRTYEAAVKPATQKELDDAGSRLAAAKATMDASWKDVQTLLNGPDAEDVALATAAVKSAKAQVTNASTALADARKGTSNAALLTAESALRQAELDLAQLTEGPSKTDLELQNLRIKSAELAVIEAKNSVADKSLKAPFNGVITEINGQPGELVSGTLVTLVDRNSMRVQANVDQIDVVKLKPGQKVLVNTNLPDTNPSQGILKSINPLGQSNQGLVTYDLSVEMTQAPKNLLGGMTVDIEVTVGEIKDAITVPSSAIESKPAGPGVQIVQSDGTLQWRQVRLGLSDGYRTQILDGIQQGERVAIGGLDKGLKSKEEDDTFRRMRRASK